MQFYGKRLSCTGMEAKHPVGYTRTAGFEIGARRTFPVVHQEAWDFLFSQEGIELWLGKLDAASLQENQSFKTASGHEGTITVFKPGSHIRLKWKPTDWHNSSIVQMRVIANKNKTTVAFHQDHLLDETQRNEMKEHWQSVLHLLGTKWSGK